MVRLRLITTAVSGVDIPSHIDVDDDATLGELRAIVAATCLPSTDRALTSGLCITDATVKLMFRGKTFTSASDAIAFLQLYANVVADEKLYATVFPSGTAGASASSGGTHYARNAAATAGGGSATGRGGGSGGDGLMPDMSPEQADQMARFMTSTPEMIEMLINSSPELKAIIQENPEAARDLKDPETLREIIRSQLDRSARRQMSQRQDLQLAHVRAMPDGEAYVQRVFGGVELAAERALMRNRDAADDAEAMEEHARPVAGASSNTAAIPNPWAQSSTEAVATPVGYGAASQAFGRGNPFAAFSGLGFPQLPPPSVAASRPPPSAVPAAAAPAPLLPTPTPPPPPMGGGFAFPAQLHMMMNEMGFTDEEQCKLALQEANGDVEVAVALLATWMT